MAKDASLFSSLRGAIEENFYVTDDYTLSFVGNGDVKCYHGHISNVYHVLNLNANPLLFSQQTKTKNTVEFWSDNFIMKDLRLGRKIVASGILDPKDGLYKLCDPPMNVSETTGLTTLTCRFIRTPM